MKSQGDMQFSVASGVGAAMTLKIQREAGDWGLMSGAKGRGSHTAFPPHSSSFLLLITLSDPSRSNRRKSSTWRIEVQGMQQGQKDGMLRNKQITFTLTIFPPR